MNQKISRVALVGGTHGNEFTGVYLIDKFEKSPELVTRSTFETVTLLANPEALKLVKRYVDTDLNRCFLRQDLANTTLESYEQKRAKEIDRLLGATGTRSADLVCDLHSTTANMQITLILHSYQPALLHLFDYLVAIHPKIKVLSLVKPEGKNHSYLSSIARDGLGFEIEVGPIAQGVLNAELFLQTEQLIDRILDWIDAWNQHRAPRGNGKLTVYEFQESIDYPRDGGNQIVAMVHPQLQFRDYEPLHPGKPIFLSFQREAIAYDGKSTVYPVFINEAAYYEKGVAMCFTQQREIAIDDCINLPTSAQLDL